MNKSHVIFDVICENHLAIFYPLPYFELEAINSVLSTAVEMIPNAQKYQDLTLHWVMLKHIQDPDFSQNFITSFDFQIICNAAPKLNGILIGDQTQPINYRNPDFAVMICDSKSHLELTDELMFMGQLIDSEENWEFYHAEQF